LNFGRAVAVRRNQNVGHDEYGLLEDGAMLASPLEALDPGFIDFARLQAGARFGVDAMEHEKPALGKIVALKRTHLLTITAAEYQAAVKEILKHQEARRVAFVSKVLLFGGLGKNNIKKLIKSSRVVHCIKDSVVQEEGRPVDRVYIV
jgi:hypothetical protein